MNSKKKGGIVILSVIIGSIMVGGLIISINQDKISFLNTGLLEKENIDQKKIDTENEVKLNETPLDETYIDTNDELLLSEDNNKTKIENDVVEEKQENEIVEEAKKELPKEVNLKVPFHSQAPDANWSLPWSEACEEASIVLAYYFIKGMDLTKEIFKEEILEIVELEKKLLGKYIDTNIEETAQILEEFYDYNNYKIIQNPTIEDLKYELSEGHPIVAPFAGKKLGNIFYQNGGPRYHMLVIVGYKDGFFLTNDVGTNRGENFEYTYETIMNALQDLTLDGDFDNSEGKSKVLVLQ